jgi:hypothetical protein
MKKNGILALAAIFALSMSVMAQDLSTPAQDQDHKGERKEFKQGERPQATAQVRAERLAKQLSLTDEQKAKVQALYEKQDANREKRKVEAQKTREEMKARFEAERKAQDAELEKIIGTEKFQKFQATRMEHQKKMQQREENNSKPDQADTK